MHEDEASCIEGEEALVYGFKSIALLIDVQLRQSLEYIVCGQKSPFNCPNVGVESDLSHYEGVRGSC